MSTAHDPDAWQQRAFADTAFLAAVHLMPMLPGSPLGLLHLMEMRIRAKSFTGAKLGRWLGWAQCAVVAADVGLTLADMEAINSRAKRESPTSLAGWAQADGPEGTR